MKSIQIVEDTLPLAWERAVLECWNNGDSFQTEYDKSRDPNSRDVTALIHIKRPSIEPRIHKCMPGGLDDLEKYRAEVLYGVHDHWINPKAGKWEYTYHDRLFNYSYMECDENLRAEGKFFNQIEGCLKLLKKCGYTRRAVASTWQPWHDLGIADPACLQYFWFRIQDRKLNMNIHIRSNDAYKAGFMNMYAFTEVQQWMADRLGVEVDEYIHIADSFDIYGSYFEEFGRFLKMVQERPLSERVYSTCGVIPGTEDERPIDIFIEACGLLLNEQDMPSIMRSAVLDRRLKLIARRESIK